MGLSHSRPSRKNGRDQNAVSLEHDSCRRPPSRPGMRLTDFQPTYWGGFLSLTRSHWTTGEHPEMLHHHAQGMTSERRVAGKETAEGFWATLQLASDSHVGLRRRPFPGCSRGPSLPGSRMGTRKTSGAGAGPTRYRDRESLVGADTSASLRSKPVPVS